MNLIKEALKKKLEKALKARPKLIEFGTKAQQYQKPVLTGKSLGMLGGSAVGMAGLYGLGSAAESAGGGSRSAALAAGAVASPIAGSLGGFALGGSLGKMYRNNSPKYRKIKSRLVEMQKTIRKDLQDYRPLRDITRILARYIRDFRTRYIPYSRLREEVTKYFQLGAFLKSQRLKRKDIPSQLRVEWDALFGNIREAYYRALDRRDFGYESDKPSSAKKDEDLKLPNIEKLLGKLK